MIPVIVGIKRIITIMKNVPEEWEDKGGFYLDKRNLGV